eukprot:PhM_4_TR17595/c0_g1_i1/m.65168
MLSSAKCNDGDDMPRRVSASSKNRRRHRNTASGPSWVSKEEPQKQTVVLPPPSAVLRPQRNNARRNNNNNNVVVPIPTRPIATAPTPSMQRVRLSALQPQRRKTSDVWARLASASESRQPSTTTTSMPSMLSSSCGSGFQQQRSAQPKTVASLFQDSLFGEQRRNARMGDMSDAHRAAAEAEASTQEQFQRTLEKQHSELDDQCRALRVLCNERRAERLRLEEWLNDLESDVRRQRGAIAALHREEDVLTQKKALLEAELERLREPVVSGLPVVKDSELLRGLREARDFIDLWKRKHGRGRGRRCL